MAKPRGLAFLPLIFTLAFSLQHLAFPQPIPASEAKANVGQEKTVTGTVMKISPVGKLTIIDIDGVFPNAPFSAVIFADKLPLFDQATLDSYKDKAVAITGKIALHKDKPQIILNDPGQITLAGAAPSPPVTPTPVSAPSTTDQSKTPPEGNPAPAQVSGQTTPPPVSPSGADKKNLALNGNFNKGKKGWELPTDAEVITAGDSQALQVKLVAGDRVYLKQTLESKIPKNTEYFEISADVKLADGAKISNGITFRIGQSFKESSYKKFEDLKPGTQTLKWPRTGKLESTENLILSIELDQGEGSIILDNIELLPAK